MCRGRGTCSGGKGGRAESHAHTDTRTPAPTYAHTYAKPPRYPHGRRGGLVFAVSPPPGGDPGEGGKANHEIQKNNVSKLLSNNKSESVRQREHAGVS